MTDRLDRLYQHIVNGPTTPPPLRRALKTAALLAREVARDQVHVRAATLAYWSLVAIVPVLLLAAAVLQPLGPKAGEPIRELIFNALLAGAVRNVGATVDGWLAQVDVARLGIIGIIVVTFTASRIYFSVEEAYNHVWNVRSKRSLIRRLALFYAVLTLGPLLIALGFQLTGSIQDAVGGSSLSLALPLLLTTAAFVGAIRALPDTDVRWAPALVGGLASAMLFELAKVGFNAYVNVLGAGDAAVAIYGSLGLFPVFLLWLYLLWTIVLFGVELAYVVQRYDVLFAAEERYLEGDGQETRHPDALFALQCLLVVAGRFAAGDGPTTEPVVTLTLQSEPTHVRKALETLEDAGLLAESLTGYLPALPLERVTLRDVIVRYRALTRPSVVEGAVGMAFVTELLSGPAALLDTTLLQLLESTPLDSAAAPLSAAPAGVRA
ncbi:MAG: YihY/virulence factor BrkB family protein [Pseudomonadota bacterium]|nr:YihY/virulence factor BrkB family protein [Pseudomonadota bacterium]